MTGWLIYHQADIQRNRVFIDKWIEAGHRRNVHLQLVTIQQLRFGIRNNAPFLQLDGQDALPSFAVMRVQQPLLSLQLESMGIPVFNNARVSRICNDKRLTHSLLQGSVPMMDTAFVDADTNQQPFAFPVVVKAAHSCGGRHVFLCRDEQSYSLALKACAPDAAVVQPLCDTPGKDVRVYVLGNRIVKTMMRYSADGDFRSNLGQGGDAQPYPLDTEPLQHVEHILSLFSFDLVGIDFIFHQGKLVFNEIEDAVGTRMLYIHTEMDIVSMYLDHILERISLISNSNVTI